VGPTFAHDVKHLNHSVDIERLLVRLCDMNANALS
jgi:hypothetical protein